MSLSKPLPLNTSPLRDAQRALSFLDLTSLNPQDSENDIARLCERAQGRFGSVAAVCVWPHLAQFARRHLPAPIAVAAVANFPEGSSDIERAVRETESIVQSGAQEVDLVLPYAQLLTGDEPGVALLLAAVRKAASGLLLKVILETGELKDGAWITRAANLALDNGADFLKTSTGKTPVSATPQAARTMLCAIASTPATRLRVGFKASGGIRSVREARVYMDLCEEFLGPGLLNPQHFRIGASSLLDDIEAILTGNEAPSPAPSSAY